MNAEPLQELTLGQILDRTVAAFPTTKPSSTSTATSG